MPGMEVYRFVHVGPDVWAAWVDIGSRRFLAHGFLSSGLLWNGVQQLTTRNSSWNGTGYIWARVPEKRAGLLRPQLQRAVSDYLAQHSPAELRRGASLGRPQQGEVA
jgi:hypothetical protein